MKKIITSLSLFLVGMLAQAQTAEVRKVSSFSKIEIDGKIELVYTETAAPSIKAVAADEQKRDNLVTEINDGTLHIYMKDNSAQNAETAKVYVTGSGICSIEAKSHAKVTVKNQLSAPELSVTLDSGASFQGLVKSARKVTLRTEKGTVFNGRVETGDFYGNFKGNAKVNLSGTAATACIKSSNAALCLAKNFAAGQLTVNAGDFSKVSVYAKDDINISVAEMAKVTYTGNPENVTMNENAIAIQSTRLAAYATIAGN